MLQKMRLQISEIANNHIKASKFWDGHSRIVTTRKKKVSMCGLVTQEGMRVKRRKVGDPLYLHLGVSKGTVVEEHGGAPT